MKPTKNRVYCPECHRTKMLFVSEDKANTFLRFNTEEITEQNGKHPIRAYFCEACAGWHLTSVETPFETSPSEQRINEYNNQKEKIKQVKIEAEVELSHLERIFLRDLSESNRIKGVNLAREICRNYRREGEFFDEILKEAGR